MRYQDVVIAGIGHELPPRVLSSAAIEDRLGPVYRRLGLADGRLELMTGIRERRYWAEAVRPSDVAARAGEDAIAKSGVDRAKIGCLIHASVCRDFLEPATANVVHDRLRLRPSCQVFDVSNACLGVLSGMLMIANMIELGQIEAGMVVAGELGKGLVDSTIERLLRDATLTRRSIKSSFASLTIGSGAAAVVLARQGAVEAGHRIMGASVLAATEHHPLCRGGSEGSGDTGVLEGGGLDMATDAEALLAAGIALARENFDAFQREVGWDASQVARILTHQVGRAHHKALFDALGLDERKSFVTYDFLGNVGSVSLPITLGLAAEQGFVARGHKVALLGIGSGLSSVMMGVEW